MKYQRLDDDTMLVHYGGIWVNYKFVLSSVGRLAFECLATKNRGYVPLEKLTSKVEELEHEM